MIEFIKELDPASIWFGYILCMIFDVIFAFTNLLLEKAFEIKKRNKTEQKIQKLKKKYTNTIKKDNNHIYCEIKNYKKLHNKLEKMRGGILND